MRATRARVELQAIACAPAVGAAVRRRIVRVHPSKLLTAERARRRILVTGLHDTNSPRAYVARATRIVRDQYTRRMVALAFGGRFHALISAAWS